jgi:thioredoxin reductase (NADPH)
MEHYDLIIIGGGPSGIATAIEAHKSNINYLLLEKGYLVNSIYNFPSNMTFFSTAERLEIGDIPFIAHSDKPTRREALEYYRRIAKSYDLNIRYKTEVEQVNKIDACFILNAKNGKQFSAQYVVVATGYYDIPKKLQVPGEELKKVKHYYDDAHPYIDMNVVVVGAANSACDVALETWQKGANVTMVVRENQLYQKVKYWILPNIENRIKEGSIKAYFNSIVKNITETTVEILSPDGETTIDNDYVLAMTGYMPNFEWLENIGIAFEHDKDQRPKIDEDTFESNIPNLYLAGVIISGLNTSELFIENTRNHGHIIVQNILTKIRS